MDTPDTETPSPSPAAETPTAPGGCIALLSHEAALVRLVLPIEAEETLAETVSLETAALSPFDEGAYATGWEIVQRTPETLTLWVAMAATDTLDARWHDALRAEGKLAKVRIDLTLFAWLRLLPEFAPEVARAHTLVLVRTAREQLLLLLHEGVLEAARALPGATADGDLAREITLLLSRSALEGICGAPDALVCLVPTPEAAQPAVAATGLEAHVVALDEAAAEARLIAALDARAEGAQGGCDLTPEAWREEARALQRKRRLCLGGTLLGCIWLLCALTLFLLPRVYRKFADDVAQQIRTQHRAYQAVQELRERVALIERYQDRSNSALEMLRLLCEVKPKPMLFLSLNYRQKQQLKVSGLTDDSSDVYAFKEALQRDPRLAEIKITRLNQDPKTRKQRFDIDITFPTEQAEDTP